MEQNVHLEGLDLREIVYFNIKCINFFGYFSPEFPQTSKRKIFYRIYAATFVGFAFVLSLLSQIANMIDSFGDMEKMTEASFLLFTNFVQCIKLYSFMANGSRVWKLVHSMNREAFRPRNSEQHEILSNEIKMSKMISKIFLIMCTITCSSWAISPFLDTSGGQGVRLPLSGWYPFSTDGITGFRVCIRISNLFNMGRWTGGHQYGHLHVRSYHAHFCTTQRIKQCTRDYEAKLPKRHRKNTERGGKIQTKSDSKH
jgi:hypothetical protein